MSALEIIASIFVYYFIGFQLFAKVDLDRCDCFTASTIWPIIICGCWIGKIWSIIWGPL